MSFLPRLQKAAYIMVRIAQNNGVPLPLNSLTDKISISYCEQIIKKMKEAGLVKAYRGPGGGYGLARPADNITLGQVADALGFDKIENKAFGLDGLKEAFDEANKSALGYLDSVSLSDIS